MGEAMVKKASILVVDEKDGEGGKLSEVWRERVGCSLPHISAGFYTQDESLDNLSRTKEGDQTGQTFVR